MFLKVQTVPFVLRKSADIKLDRLTIEDILKQINHFKWVLPQFPDLNSNDLVRICGDYTATINAYTENIIIFLPRKEKSFCKIIEYFNLKDVNFQQPLDDETLSKVLTINTHTGLFSGWFQDYLLKIVFFFREKQSVLNKFDDVGVFPNDVTISDTKV